jgi:tetratricopeptide (TPR) repeat protein
MCTTLRQCLLLLLLALLFSACASSVTAPNTQVYLDDGRQALRDLDWGAALDSFDAALQIDSSLRDALVGRGCAGLQNYAAALADFDSAVQADPTDGSAWAGRGRAKLNLGDNAGRSRSHGRAELSPLRAGSYFDRGLAYYRIKEYDSLYKTLHVASAVTAAHCAATSIAVSLISKPNNTIRPSLISIKPSSSAPLM